MSPPHCAVRTAQSSLPTVPVRCTEARDAAPLPRCAGRAPARPMRDAVCGKPPLRWAPTPPSPSPPARASWPGLLLQAGGAQRAQRGGAVGGRGRHVPPTAVRRLAHPQVLGAVGGVGGRSRCGPAVRGSCGSLTRLTGGGGGCCCALRSRPAAHGSAAFLTDPAQAHTARRVRTAPTLFAHAVHTRACHAAPPQSAPV